MGKQSVKKRLLGQSALVTGANTGIGRAIALSLAVAGARVAVNYIAQEEETNTLLKEIQSAGGEAIPVKADVSKEDDVSEMFDTVIKTFAPLISWSVMPVCNVMRH